MDNKIVSAAICFLVVCFLQTGICHAAAKAVPKARTVNESNSYFYAPAGITCDAVLSENIHSSSAIIGQNVSAILIDDLKYKGKVIATSGSTILGTITQNKIAGKGSNTTKLRIRFTTIRTLYNNIIPISAIVLTDDKTGYLVAVKEENDNNVALSANSKINLLFDQPITVTAQ